MVNPATLPAKEVAEILLETTRQALLSNDYDLFSRCFALPHEIETPDKKTILKTPTAMQAVFQGVVADYRSRGVTDLIRICEVAQYRGPLRIESTHVTHMMAGDRRIGEPFPVFSVLEFVEDRWQATSSQYAVDNQTTVGRALSQGTSEFNQT